MTLTRFFRDFGLYAAWLVAIVAMAGSLYFSEVRAFVPCNLCWYQRVLMYPLVILLGIASYRQDRAVIPYALPFTLIGGGVAMFHYMEQKIPGFGAPAMCRVGVPCNVEYINWLGFITIPFLALTAFVLITTILAGVLFTSRQPRKGYTAGKDALDAQSVA